MKQMRILFVCKHNIFRSRVAEDYFKKTNKNKKISADSAGVISGEGTTPKQNRTIRRQIAAAKKFGLNISGKSKGLSIKLLKKQDLIIIVADDVPKVLFNYRDYVKKVIVWKIKDVDKKKGRIDKPIIQEIIKKIDELVKGLGGTR